jgi:hypothetical protein
MALVRERTVPTERPPLIGEVSAKFFGVLHISHFNIWWIPEGLFPGVKAAGREADHLPLSEAKAKAKAKAKERSPFVFLKLFLIN